ncbi:portal protein [Sphingopyxis sp. 113P3]|uniref:portal protein n=1 Tax=Sphingopyxis sp. (strain 113P3) TaxID=292913 RepID=UPI0006BC3D14|nr:portal protein [Sphingopyxis sp. 113P3]ALC13826.1 tail protein [Sphingopyxis sp. 113P3]
MSIRQDCETRLSGMKTIRQDYEDEVRNIARFAQPSRSRFLATEKNKGGRRRLANNRLLDPHGILAARTLTNGMTSGLSSASTPWFTLAVADELMEAEGVRDWLSDVQTRMYSFLAATNFYSAAKTGYGETGLFGTEATVMVEHPRFGAVCHSLTFGEYWIALSDAMRPDTLYRLCPMTVRQAVMSFGDAVQPWIRSAYDRSDYEKDVEVYQAIEPDPGGRFNYRSVYWDASDGRDVVLRTRGYTEQPFWAPRWDVAGGDVYGTAPGMEALPALRELQLQTKRRNEAIDLMVHPEKIVPPQVRLTGQPRSIVTGNGVQRENIVVPYAMPYQAVEAIRQEIEKCKEQIDALFYADLFNAITNMRGIQPRNMEEIAKRNEEKLTQLGPVIERVSTEKLMVVIDRTFSLMERGRLLPPAPPALRETDLKVEFVSILTQMQRLVGIGQIERSVSFVGNLAAAFPEAVDKINIDETIDEYAQRAGTPSKIIRSTAEAGKLRQARQAEIQQRKMLETVPAVQQGADAARLLSETDVGGEPLLDTLLGA